MAANTIVYIGTSGTTTASFTVPNDWSNVNIIECWGGGSASNNSSTYSGYGGGYASIRNVQLTPGTVINLQAGKRGVFANVYGGDSYFGNFIHAGGGGYGTRGLAYKLPGANGYTTRLSYGGFGGSTFVRGGGAAGGTYGNGGSGGYLGPGGGAAGGSNAQDYTNAPNGANNIFGLGGGSAIAGATDGGGGAYRLSGSTFNATTYNAGGNGSDSASGNPSYGAGGGGAWSGNGGNFGGGSGLLSSSGYEIVGGYGAVLITYWPATQTNDDTLTWMDV